MSTGHIAVNRWLRLGIKGRHGYSIGPYIMCINVWVVGKICVIPRN